METGPLPATFLSSSQDNSQVCSMEEGGCWATLHLTLTLTLPPSARNNQHHINQEPLIFGEQHRDLSPQISTGREGEEINFAMTWRK